MPPILANGIGSFFQILTACRKIEFSGFVTVQLSYGEYISKGMISSPYRDLKKAGPLPSMERPKLITEQPKFCASLAAYISNESFVLIYKDVEY